MSLRDLRHRLQEGAGRLVARLADRLADDARFWRTQFWESQFVPRVAVGVLAAVLFGALLVLVIGDAVITVLFHALVTLGWGGILNPFTALIGMIFIVSTYAMRARPSFASTWAIVLYVGSFALANTWRIAIAYFDRDLAVQLYTLAAFDVIAVQAWLIWYLVRRPGRLHEGDVIAQLYWTVYAFAETGQVFEYLGCKILYDPYTDLELMELWAVAVEVTSCGRAFGGGSEYVLPAITTLFLLWPAKRAFQAWHH